MAAVLIGCPAGLPWRSKARWLTLPQETRPQWAVTALTARSAKNGPMDSDDPFELRLRDELAWARAEEAEALRRARHLRAIGSLEDIREATQQVDALHRRIASLQQELHDLQPA